MTITESDESDTTKPELHPLDRHDAILQAVARGWCHPTTSDRTMDEALAVAIAEEVEAIL